ncbi:hypothetical protein [Schaalia vaccimaxillae]|uniref:variant leucine-rich repeat-containing protein n=1 Tax=Schaalia vaccimaxillae TaxID=183916 RepID=UPI0003B36285|nr:hypothetical protein [Schaalia vaccimaxillae]
MADDLNIENPQAAVQDPAADAETLRQIAYRYPHLRAAVAAHPKAYQGLLDWMAAFGDPGVLRAIESRSAASSPVDSGAVVADVEASDETFVAEDSPQEFDGEATQMMASIDEDFDQPAAGPVQRASIFKNAPQDATAVIPDQYGVSAQGGIQQGSWQQGSAAYVAHAAPNSPQQWLSEPSAGAGAGAGAGVGAAGAGFGGAGGAAPSTSNQPAPSYSASPQAGFGGPASSQARPQRLAKSNKGLVATLVGLVVLALVLLVAVAYVFTDGFGTGKEPAPSAGSEQSAPATDTAEPKEPAVVDEPESDPAPVEEEDKYPAPANARQITSFKTPSGNIACVLNTDQTVCQIFKTEWSGTGYGECNQAGGALIVEEKSAANSCAQGDTALVTDQLEYGEYAVSGDFVCSSTMDGVSCWNTKSGASFALARGGWMTGLAGEITPDKYTW